MNSHKPGLVLFHRSYCGACKRLGNDVRQNKQLIELSKQFVMISCDGTNDPEGDAFEIGIVFSMIYDKIDGKYVPRVFFINPNNTLNYSIVSNTFQYKYFYSSSKQLYQKMDDYLHSIEIDQVTNLESEL